MGSVGGVSKAFKSIGLVAGVTMLSRVLGLARDMLTTAVFGASALNSAFVTAFTLPNLFRRLLGEGALTAALVPTMHEELERQRMAGAHRLLSKVSSWLLVVTVLIVGGAIAMMVQVDVWGPRLTQAGMDDDTLQRWRQGAELAVLLFPYLVFVCMAAAFSAALQTFNRFLEPALSPVWLNLSMIGLLAGAAFLGWAETDMGRMRWLCAGVLLGGFLQMAVPAATLMREGWRPRFDLRRDEGLRQIARLMGPTVFGSAIYLVNMAVSRVLGLSLNDGAATILNLATRLMELPIGVFAVAVSTVIFPLIARHAARGDGAGLAEAYHQGMRLILVINIPAAVGLAVLAEPIIRLLFERGAFGAEDTAAMVPVLAACAVGLPFLSFVSLALRAFYARKDTKTPVRAAAWSFIVNVGASLALMGPLSTLGLAVAGNLAVVVQAVYLQRTLTARRPELGFGHVLVDVAKVVAASAVMGGVVAAAWWAWERVWGEAGWVDVTGVAVGIGAGVAVYAGAVWLLKVSGRETVLAMVLRKGRG